MKPDDELPEGFVADELPEGFTLDTEPNDGVPRIPGRSDTATAPRQPVATQPPSFWDFLTGAPRQGHAPAPGTGMLRAGVGAGETALALGTGATSGAISGTLGMANTVGADLLKLALGMQPSGQSLEQAFTQGAQAGTFQPRTGPGQEMTQSAGQFMGEALPPLIGAPRMPPGALKQGIQGLRETPGVAIPQSVARAGAAVADAMTPTISAERARLAKVADNLGIKLAPHQLAGGRIMEKAGELAESVPMAGSEKAARQEAFNKAVIKQINPEETATRLTPDVYDAALERAGTTIGDVAGRAIVKLPGKLKVTLNKLWNDAARSGEGDSPRIIPNLIEDIAGSADDAGFIPGKTLRETISDIGRKIRATQNGDYKNRLNELQDTLLDALESSVSKEYATAFRNARKEYAIAKQIEPVVAKMVDGDVPPAALLARVTATRTGKEYVARGMGGEIADLAKIGQLMKEPASSGTSERSLVYQAVKGTAEAGKMAAAYPLAAAYNLLGPEITRRMTAKGQATPLTGPPEAPLTTSLGFEQANQGAPLAPPVGSISPAQMALVPDYGLSLGFEGVPQRSSGAPGGSRRPMGIAPPEIGAPQPRLAPSGQPATPPAGGRRSQIPAVPGRPDLPDVMPVESFGQPKGVFADPATIGAMDDPAAQLARQQQLGGATMTQQDLLMALARQIEQGQRQSRATPVVPPAKAPAAAPAAPPVTTPGSLKAEKSAQRANNASGESAASQEAINRVAREKAAGQTRTRWSGGKMQQLIGPDAVDQRVGPKDIVLQRGVGKNEWTVLNQGKDVKQSDIARAIAEAKKGSWK